MRPRFILLNSQKGLGIVVHRLDKLVGHSAGDGSPSARRFFASASRVKPFLIKLV